MKKKYIFEALATYVAQNPRARYLLPVESMERIYDHIVSSGARACLELGTGRGMTTCVMAAAVEENGGGRVITVDKILHPEFNVKVIQEFTGITGQTIEVVVDPLGYNWYLAELLRQRARGTAQPRLFDFCFLDGAHEWEPDALAALLAVQLLRPGATLALDDVHTNLRTMFPNWSDLPQYSGYTERQLDSFQVRMIYDLLIAPHPEIAAVWTDERLGWARKRRTGDMVGLRRTLRRVLKTMSR